MASVNQQLRALLGYIEEEIPGEEIEHITIDRQEVASVYTPKYVIIGNDLDDKSTDYIHALRNPEYKS